MAESRRLLDGLAVAAAVLASIGLVDFATGSWTVTLAFASGLTVLGLIAFAAARYQAAPAEQAQAASPDWSVTVAAIEQPGQAIAITDRANRLVCANAAFELWFGSGHAPPRLPVDGASSELLTRLARGAWRDGNSGEVATIADEERSWTAEATRAGRGDDYLIWRFGPILRNEPLVAMTKHITGMFGRILGAAGICVALVGGDGTIRAVNPAFARRANGDEEASMAGQEFVSLLRSDERERIFFAREGAKGTPQTLVHVPLSDPAERGPEEPVPSDGPSLMMLLDAGVGLGGWGGEARGQTPQLEALLEQLPLGLAMTDRDGHFLFANPAFRRAAGVEGKNLPPYPSDIVIPRDKTAMSDAVRRFGQGAANSGDIAVRLRVEPDDPVSLGLAGVRGLGEAAVLLSLADTTEETRLKRQVAQATKMQAVGQLAGGVAHDFNNVLTAIIGYCDLMLLRHTPGDSDYDDIQQIKANSNRAASLTRQLLAFSRQQTLQPEVLQLPDVLSEVGQLLKRLLGAKITLKVTHDRNLGAVRADPRQLEQVIINLAVNARDAIQSSGGGETASGTLSFATRRVEAKDIRRMGSEIIPAGDYTVLIAEDTGGGIPTEVLGNIFEPFFTTKEQGKGTGLGLSTVYGIVKQSGGFIFASNTKGSDGRVKGARFTIYLPVHTMTEDDVAKAEAEEEARNWSGGGRVLLVEDEDMVRAVAERALTRQGYDVVTASDGDEGLELVKAGEEFDLVVSDVVMPSMDGPAMAREIRKLQPRLPILFMSGYAEEQLRNEIDIEAMHFIAKPFSVQQIADKAAGVLSGKGQGR
ncbi:hybrid sensor histidine kinase/response regulator [Alteraurantiacibacter aquimixticola]|uniref:histidine kinase n=1 Tax=Alteraurantiacibacter aquimixticola TaxID=2489173 RepID=A0A4T3EZY1_9SPHN|nr:PAS domain-containing sensor histidine kinase [Alteraurantiacibacter aquimixticola]TIX50351.1 PAS domain-containing sensor histidine kinase [Alteraurantiacibacter aquimixticola]